MIIYNDEWYSKMDHGMDVMFENGIPQDIAFGYIICIDRIVSRVDIAENTKADLVIEILEHFFDDAAEDIAKDVWNSMYEDNFPYAAKGV